MANVSGVKFSYKGAEGTKALSLRLGPTQVSWTYNLNSRIIDTFGGQVVQILSTNIANLTLEGQFGREGPYGRTLQDRRYEHRPPGELHDTSAQGDLRVGLHQFVSYFRDYFSQASQGGDRGALDAYNEASMSVEYVDLDDLFPRRWTGYPINLPSFQRSKENFAPKWQVQFEVSEPDPEIARQTMNPEIEKIQALVGYTVFNPFSDPLASLVKNPEVAKEVASTYTEAIVDSLRAGYIRYTQSFTDEQLRELVDLAISGPQTGEFIQGLEEKLKAGAGDIDAGE